MKSPAVLIALIAIGFAGNCAAQSDSLKPDANSSIFKSYGFPSHPDLTHLCQKHVYGSGIYGSGSEITWDAFVSKAEPSEVVEYYLRKLSKAGFTREDKGGTWRLPAGNPRPKRVLNIIPVGTDSPARACEENPPSDSRTIILLSRMSS